MADAIQFNVPANDFVELVGAGTSGSLFHQGAQSGAPSNIVFVESATKPTFDQASPSRFKSGPVSFTLADGDATGYFDATTIWAVSAQGTQLLTVTPA